MASDINWEIKEISTIVGHNRTTTTTILIPSLQNAEMPRAQGKYKFSLCKCLSIYESVLGRPRMSLTQLVTSDQSQSQRQGPFKCMFSTIWCGRFHFSGLILFKTG